MDAPSGSDAGSSGSAAAAPEVRRIGPAEGSLLRRVRLDAVADSPGDFTARLADVEARPQVAWDRVAAVHATADDQVTWFAEVGGEVAGMVSAFRTEDGAVTMTSLWSSPGHRRTGLADVLVATVRDWAVAAGAPEVRQWLVERNRHARAFHEGLGFAPTGVERPYEPSPSLREVELRLSLR